MQCSYSGDTNLAVFDSFSEAGLSMMLYAPLIHRVEHLVRVVNNLKCGHTPSSHPFFQIKHVESNLLLT